MTLLVQRIQLGELIRLEVSAAAQKWLDDHKSKWDPWVASSK